MMIRSRTLAHVSTVSAVLAGMTALTGTALSPPAVAGGPVAGPGPMTRLAGSTVPFSGPAAARRVAAGSSQLTVQVWLTQQEAAAERYATAVARPGNPLFGHYLSPAGYAARFGATASEARAVESWLHVTGFGHVTTDLGRNYVRATASVAVIDRALHIQVGYYASRPRMTAGGNELRGYDQPISVPAALDASVLGVTGLDNAAPAMTYALPGSSPGSSASRGLNAPPVPVASPRPAPPKARGNDGSFPCSAWYGQHYATHLAEIFGAARFPTQLCGYSARQLRAAYGYTAKYSGRGQTIALVELGLTPYMFRTLQDYARANDITAPVATRYMEMGIGRGANCGNPFGIEEQTDVEASYMMSPGATHLVVGGDTCDNGDYGLQGLFDADTAVLDGSGGDPLASIVSNSWEGFSENQPAFIDNVEHALLVRAAAEGVGMYFATGDNSGVLTPASDPYAIAVGGTSLGIGAANPRVMETGWSTGMFTGTGAGWAFQGEAGAGGGGPSLLWAQPAYQRGVVPRSMARPPGGRGGLVRTIPDVSADADPFTGMAVGTLTLNASGQPASYNQSPVGGTSLASPIVAALVADAQQGMPRSFGFINPVLYRLARTRAFHDVYPVTPRTASQYRAIACSAAACGVLSLVNFDDQSYSMPGYTGQVTRAGYGTMTGVGTLNGPYFAALIRKLEN
jgi:subtilase family serine protease